MTPRITIITPSYQQEAYLEECLASVHAQGYPELEHIVVDGGSTDGSKAIIERYADRLAWWCSEPDAGQSHAINKGLERATGQVFAWLNSDDILLPGALHTVARWFSEDPSAWAHRGRLIIREGAVDRVFPDSPIMHCEHTLYLDPLVVQQSTFFRTDAVRELGGCEPALHHVMDLELQWQLLFREGSAGLRSHDEVLAVFRSHPASKTSLSRAGFLAEQSALLRDMLLATGQNDLAALFSIGRELPGPLRAIPVGEAHRDLVRRMARHFLLKWDHVVMERGQFDRMRALRDLLPLEAEPLSRQESQWAEQAMAAVAVSGWLEFRVKRKWKHLTDRE